ncbi:fam-c protein [Plasmodium vinckei]|uniref:Fam-c protein n=1 Tax=Plasmodium vinckei TaxID=5860 RepID=A0A6V7SLA2_PLAVN|nr:fam-c protein [Plasmodium vinckei]
MNRKIFSLVCIALYVILAVPIQCSQQKVYDARNKSVRGTKEINRSNEKNDIEFKRETQLNNNNNNDLKDDEDDKDDKDDINDTDYKDETYDREYINEDDIYNCEYVNNDKIYNREYVNNDKIYNREYVNNDKIYNRKYVNNDVADDKKSNCFNIFKRVKKSKRTKEYSCDEMIEIFLNNNNGRPIDLAELIKFILVNGLEESITPLKLFESIIQLSKKQAK